MFSTLVLVADLPAAGTNVPLVAVPQQYLDVSSSSAERREESPPVQSFDSLHGVPTFVSVFGVGAGG